jgi:N-methylhydantoinase A/oxoprolinase/acetone carboxylase beta subunit
MALEVVYFLNDSFSRDDLNAFMKKSSDDTFMRFKIDIPVILIGAPVHCFISELREFLDAEIITPAHYDVGNAVGCLEGKLAKRFEIQIDVESLQEESGVWVTNFITYTTDGQKTFSNKEAALHYVESLGKKDIYKYMTENDIRPDDVEIRIKNKEVGFDPLKPPVQIDVVMEGFAENKFD